MREQVAYFGWPMVRRHGSDLVEPMKRGEFTLKLENDLDSMQSYQQFTRTTKVYTSFGYNAIVYTALGLAGEAGEVANKVKKVMRGDTEFTDDAKQEIAAELGDLLWYIARCADEIGYPLAEIAAMNAGKLRARQQAGTLKGSGDQR